MFLFLGLYLQVILGFSPLKSGFAFLPFTAGIIVFAGIASQLLPKVGPKPLMVPGLIFAGIGLLLLTRITPETAYFSHVVPSLLIMSSRELPRQDSRSLCWIKTWCNHLYRLRRQQGN
jgi:hypothetical protein